MFKTIGKVLLILALAALISYGLYGLVQNGSLNGISFGSEHEFNRFNSNNQITASFASQSRPIERFHEHDRGASVFGLFGVIGTALQMGLITLVVVSLQGWIKTLNRNKRRISSYA